VLKQLFCWLLAASLLSGFICSPVLAAAKKRASSSSASVSAPAVAFSPFPPMIHPIRIGLEKKAGVARFAVWAPGAVFVDNVPVMGLNPGMIYTFVGGRIVEMGTGRSVALPVDRRTHVTASDYRIWTNNRWYRGILELINFGSSVTVINLLDLEEYLLGVVPSEMPASWHLEALKAQAVAARSYAFAHMGPGKSKWLNSEGYDLVPDVRDQAYKGLAAEANSTFRAVRETRGIILKDSGKVKPGFYRAWVGDTMENLNLRKSAIPTAYLEKICAVPNIMGVTVKQWDPVTGNARSIQVMGAKKSREVDGVALARMAGLSTAGVLDISPAPGAWVFTYRGPGNGARGLSQHGANMFAARGWRFDQILTQYYQDNDGKLRLDYMDNYKAATVPGTVFAAPQAQRAPAPTATTDEQ
jgi:hypothetical protein